MNGTIVNAFARRSASARACAVAVAGSSLEARPARMAWTGRLRARRAVLLLEVVVALAILVTAMGLLGAQLVGGMKMTAYSDEQTKASQLADRILALLELDPDTVQRLTDEQQSDGDFGKAHPRWFWRITVEPLPDVEGVGQLIVQVLHQPDEENSESIDGAKVVRELRMLKAPPGRVDLAADFGLEQEAVDALAGSLPIPGLNPSALDPLALASLPPEQLLALLPQLLPLLQQFFPGANLPTDLSPEGLAGMLDQLRGGGGAGAPDEDGDPRPGGRPPGFGGGGPGGGNSLSQNFLRDFIRQQLAGQVSEEEMNQLFGNLGGGGGGSTGGPGGGRGGIRPGVGNGGNNPGGGGGGAGAAPGRRGGRTINDLNSSRGG